LKELWEEEAMVKPQIRENSDDSVLKVIEAKTVGGKVIVTVEGTNLERLMSPEARSLAYEQRMKFGMANGGIEALSGTFVPAEELRLVQEAKEAGTKRNVERWQREFSITQMI
jgi:hypothetical protein